MDVIENAPCYTTLPAAAASGAVTILGVRVHGLPLAGMLNNVLAWSRQSGAAEARRTLLYVNAHCLNLAWTDPEYRRILNAADLVYPDGISVVWSSRWLGGCALTKLTGADWIGPYCALAARAGLRTYLLGGRPGVAERAALRLETRYPGLPVVGWADGFFPPEEDDRALAAIAAARPDVVFVGMGAPRQEKWIAAHRERIAAPVCWGVGALFDFVAGVERRVPGWMNALALEWFWRLLMDPFGKWKRYLLGNPLFLYRVVRQKWQRGEVGE